MTASRSKRRRNSLVIQIMSIKKPTALDKISEKVPKPRGAVPTFGLPKWKYMPLDLKIPMIPAPKDAYNITRKKLGKKLWVQTKNAKFNLNDPYNREIEFTYDPLHDEHLARYYSRKRNTRRLLKLGFINKDLDAICTLKDYNMYRAFLKKLYADRINAELKRQQDLHKERRILGFAETNAKREMDGLKKAERKTLAREKAREELRLMKKRKMQERRDLAEGLRQRLESKELAKEEEKRVRILKLRASTERARRKRAAISEIQQDRVVRNLAEWARKESNLRKAQRERLARQAEEKRKTIEETWQRRKEEEESEIARKQAALRYAEEERDKFIKSYTSKVERERTKFQKRPEPQILISLSDLKALSGEKLEPKMVKYRDKFRRKLDAVSDQEGWEADYVIEYPVDHDYALPLAIDYIVYYVTGFLF